MRINREALERITSGALTVPGAGIGTRGNGFWWALDPTVSRSDLDLVDHEDWIYGHLAVPRGGVYVDVGSFVGTHAIRIAKDCGARVVAFEPVEQHRRLLIANAAINGVSPQVEVVPKAVGASRSTVLFQVDGPCNSKVSRQESRLQTFEIESTTLDESLQHLDRVDVVKIDVEGLEYEVLNGSVEIAHTMKPKFIVEVHSHMKGCEDNGNLIQQWIKGNGYKCRRIWHNTDAYYYVELTPAN